MRGFFFCVFSLLDRAPECDSNYDVSIRTLTRPGVQSTVPEMVGDNRNFFHLHSGPLMILFFQRHSCNPVSLFDAVVEKYCPDNMMQIKVCLFHSKSYKSY